MSSFEKISPAESGHTSPSDEPPTDPQPAPSNVMTSTDPEIAPAPLSAPTAPPAAAPPKSNDPMRELEEAAAVAAAAAAGAAAHTKEAAKQATDKIIKGAAEARKEITSLVSTLWAAFDSPAESRSKQHGSAEDLRARLGLAEGEAILETFRCKLIQQYAPVGNSFTPAKNIAFSGQLHIATASVSFELDGAGGAAARPVHVPASNIAEFVREGDAIVVKLNGPGEAKSFVLGQFALPKLEVDSALALLEHLTSGEVAQ